MDPEVAAGQEPEQTAGTVTPEQGAAPVNAEQESREPEKYVSAGEFKRRFSRLEDQLNTAIQYMAAQNRPAQAPAQTSVGEPTDEELYTLATQYAGTPDGQRYYAEWTRRQARKEVQQAQQAQSGQNIVRGRLQKLMQQYPVLNDGSHPLTQAMNSKFQGFLAIGYPRNEGTLLEAAQEAISDNPHLVTELYSQTSRAGEHARQSATRSAQSGMTGSTVRQGPPRREGQAREATEAEVGLARRMNLMPNPKHPEEKTVEQRVRGAKERFLKRQNEGLSTIDPRMLPVVERMSEEF